MPVSRHTNGLLAVVSLAVIGYLLFTLPPRVLEHYETATKLGTWPAYLYLAAVLTGALILFALAIGVLTRVWQNTRRKTAEVKRRNLSPSEMSSGERTRELGENLAAGKEYATGEGVSPQLRAEIEAAVADLEAKRQSHRLEIVAFGTISSGKSSLLNALAGRDVFRTHVGGGTTVTRSENPWVAAATDCVTLVDTPGLAEVRGETRAADSPAAAKNADL